MSLWEWFLLLVLGSVAFIWIPAARHSDLADRVTRLEKVARANGWDIDRLDND